MRYRSNSSVESLDRVPLHLHRLLAEPRVQAVQPRWWLIVPITLAFLVVVDVLIGFWSPRPTRLPEQFSPAYLHRLVDTYRGKNPVLFLGDSVIWGYRLPANDAAATLLMNNSPHNLLNLSYEGGSSVNSYFMLRYVLSQGVRPRLIVFNVNSKESNSADSAYQRLHPSLEPLVAGMFTSADRKHLQLQPSGGVATTLNRAVEHMWGLYRYRVDLREAMFHDVDATTALTQIVQRATGSARLQAAEHQPTADKFLGTYDLAPLTDDNVDFIYLRKLAALLHRSRIPAIAILTPTNHSLLHDYIDVPEYQQKLQEMRTALQDDGVIVLDYDAAFSASDFIDNDHLTAAGNRRLALMLRPVIEKMPGI